MATVHIIRPAANGRISLGKHAAGSRKFHAAQDPDGLIILEPFTEIPTREEWLFENKSALSAVNEGLDPSAHGNLTIKATPQSLNLNP